MRHSLRIDDTDEKFLFSIRLPFFLVDIFQFPFFVSGLCRRLLLIKSALEVSEVVVN